MHRCRPLAGALVERMDGLASTSIEVAEAMAEFKAALELSQQQISMEASEAQVHAQQGVAAAAALSERLAAAAARHLVLPPPQQPVAAAASEKSDQHAPEATVAELFTAARPGHLVLPMPQQPVAAAASENSQQQEQAAVVAQPQPGKPLIGRTAALGPAVLSACPPFIAVAGVNARRISKALDLSDQSLPLDAGGAGAQPELMSPGGYLGTTPGGQRERPPHTPLEPEAASSLQLQADPAEGHPHTGAEIPTPILLANLSPAMARLLSSDPMDALAGPHVDNFDSIEELQQKLEVVMRAIDASHQSDRARSRDTSPDEPPGPSAGVPGSSTRSAIGLSPIPAPMPLDESAGSNGAAAGLGSLLGGSQGYTLEEIEELTRALMGSRDQGSAAKESRT